MDTTREYRGHLGPPLVASPIRADQFSGPISGRRVILDTAEGHVRDCRAVSEVLRELDLAPEVLIIVEGAWYVWQLEPESTRTPRPRGAVAWPATMVYVEP